MTALLENLSPYKENIMNKITTVLFFTVIAFMMMACSTTPVTPQVIEQTVQNAANDFCALAPTVTKVVITVEQATGVDAKTQNATTNAATATAVGCTAVNLVSTLSGTPTTSTTLVAPSSGTITAAAPVTVKP
jgi:starvation-inducible outer membrane lipoprotein